MTTIEFAGGLSLPAAQDERSFVKFEEDFIFALQKLIRSKPNMTDKATIIELCANFEESIFNEAHAALSIDVSIPIWSNRELFDVYLQQCHMLLENVNQRPMDWAAEYDEFHRRPGEFFQLVSSGAVTKKRRGPGTGAKKAGSGGGAKAAVQPPVIGPDGLPIPVAPKKAAVPRGPRKSKVSSAANASSTSASAATQGMQLPLPAIASKFSTAATSSPQQQQQQQVMDISADDHHNIMMDTDDMDLNLDGMMDFDLDDVGFDD